MTQHSSSGPYLNHSSSRSLLMRVRTVVDVLRASQQAAVGGQAVMEGVMMRSPHHWAVAIRRYDGTIVEVHREHTSLASRHVWARMPIIRGVVALYESLRIGFRSLSVSAHFAAEAAEIQHPADEQRDGRPSLQHEAAAPEGDSTDVRIVHLAETEQQGSEANPDSISGWQLAIAFIFAFGFSIALFKVAPVLLTKWAGVGGKSFTFVAVESAIRIGIFIGYLALVGLMPDVRRVFQFHSAEHKAINAWERGVPLEPVAVNAQSRIHVRCGTAFMLWVFVVAIAVFGLYGYWFHPNTVELIVSRVVLLPFIAGISFELIRFAGKYPTHPVLRAILAPGLWMQYLTTRPCTEDQCEVAIASLKAVLSREYPDLSFDNRFAELEDYDEPVQVMA